tara:strand:- start:332 stop:1855 length:1524 start_codon:yes stop_codon:yes gene_type:complete
MFLTLVSFAFVISVLVFIHELGHYLAARSTGMRVEKFSVGFPPRFLSFTSMPGGWDFKIFFYKVVDKKFVWAPIFEMFINSKSKKGSGTEYCFALLPLGGYVKVSGILDESMDPNSTGADYEYQSKKTWQKLWFTSAGVIFNFVLAFIIFIILLAFTGYPKNKIDLVVDKLFPDLIEDVTINGNQLEGDDYFYSRLSYSPDTLNHHSLIDNENGYIVFNNLVADDIEKIEATMPFNINSFSEGLSDSNSSVKIDLEPGSKKFSIQSINQSNLLSDRRYYIGKVNHSALKLEKGPAYGRILKGDRILSISNSSTNQTVKYSKDIIPLIESSDNLDFQILRDGVTVPITNIRPVQFYRYDQYGNKESYGRLGVSFENEKLNLFELLNVASNSLFEGIAGTASGIFELITGQVSAKGASGPIGIAKMSGEFASQGFLSLLSLMAMLSISLGVINILPFPGLDGGHALIAIIEKIKGSKISAKTLVRVQQFGMWVLLSLFVLIFLKDLKII